uniref:Uncharacterized protein n=1 Tax=Noccaea caerulescens TaxID=107243 RepID=A0A1J3CJ29_NOCCA
MNGLLSLIAAAVAVTTEKLVIWALFWPDVSSYFLGWALVNLLGLALVLFMGFALVTCLVPQSIDAPVHERLLHVFSLHWERYLSSLLLLLSHDFNIGDCCHFLLRGALSWISLFEARRSNQFSSRRILKMRIGFQSHLAK